MFKFVLVIIAYLIGSIPFSYILGKFIKKDDIRKHGSGNLGTTNAYRVFGKVIGTLVLVLDTLKGGLIVFLLQKNLIFYNIELLHPLVYGFAAVLGHVFPVWFKFKGGKGVATSFGLLVGYSPILALSILPAFLVIELATRYVSIASVVSTLLAFYCGISLYFGSVYEHYDLTFVIVLFLAVVLIFWRHKDNFHMIRQGTENKISFDISSKIKRFRHKD
jgi:glycerol-3-phosphate acyltransferase PlsY